MFNDNVLFLNILINVRVFFLIFGRIIRNNFCFPSGNVRDALRMSLLCADGGPFSTTVAKRVSPYSKLTCLSVPFVWRLLSCHGV